MSDDRRGEEVIAGMKLIPGGVFRMGSDVFYPEEAPTREVSVGTFLIDETPVTNAQFARFVAQTGYRTEAESAPSLEDYPGLLAEAAVPGSSVFLAPDADTMAGRPMSWWQFVPGANWRAPYGLDVDFDALLDHPVVHVAYRDALAYATWAGKCLPSEAEWEFAARGGIEGAEFAWGDELAPEGRMMANYWQGEFPTSNLLLDGWARTSPVREFPANGYGLYDMIGNVWEWTSDPWTLPGDTTGGSPGCCGQRGSRGKADSRCADPADPVKMPPRVIKGGSHLCAPNYCQRYRPAARHSHAVDTSTSHIGFRCVVRVASL
jgi:formylglycine-generating enzyme